MVFNQKWAIICPPHPPCNSPGTMHPTTPPCHQCPAAAPPHYPAGQPKVMLMEVATAVERRRSLGTGSGQQEREEGSRRFSPAPSNSFCLAASAAQSRCRVDAMHVGPSWSAPARESVQDGPRLCTRVPAILRGTGTNDSWKDSCKWSPVAEPPQPHCIPGGGQLCHGPGGPKAPSTGPPVSHA